MKEDTHPLTGESMEYFHDYLSTRKKTTEKQYIRDLAELLECLDMDTETLYNHVTGLLEEKDRRKITRFEKRLTDYATSLIVDRELKKNTVLNRVKAFNAFMRANMVQYRYKLKLNGEIRDNEDTRELLVTEGADAATIEEIKSMMGLTGSPRSHAILMTLKDSGLRVSDVARIRVKDIRGALEDESIEYATFEIMPLKNLGQDDPLPANPVLGPEALRYIRRWIDYARSRYSLFNPLDDDDYLFVSVKSTPDDDGELNRFKPLDGSAIGDIVFNIVYKHPDQFRDKISAHSFRHTHTTYLTAGGVPERWINVMQGRKGKGTQGIYQKPNTRQLIEAYSQGYTEISLESDAARELEQLKAKQSEQNGEVAALRAELENIKSMFSTPDPSQLADALNTMILKAQPGELEKIFPPEYVEALKKRGVEK